MFLPGEMFFSAALQQDPSLIEFGVSEKVVPATPTTLIALLRAVAYGWRQENLAENADRIRELGEDLYQRLATFTEHLARLGVSLESSVGAYNKAVGSFDTRILPGARKFAELGIAGKDAVAELEQIERAARKNLWVKPPEPVSVGTVSSARPAGSCRAS